MPTIKCTQHISDLELALANEREAMKWQLDQYKREIAELQVALRDKTIEADDLRAQLVLSVVVEERAKIHIPLEPASFTWIACSHTRSVRKR